MVKLSPFQLAAMLLVMLCSFTVSVTVAYNIGAIMLGYDASASQAGFVATSQGLGTAVGAFLASRLVAAVAPRRIFVTGCAVLAIANALSAYAPAIEWLTGFQLIGGFGTGLVMSTVMSSAARTEKPEMTYGFLNASFGVWIIMLGFVMPAVILSGGISGAYLFYTAIAVLGIGTAFLAPNAKAILPEVLDDDPAADPAIGLARRKARMICLLALTGFGVFFLAQSGLGAFVERIGRASDVSLVTIGQVFAVGGLLTIIGPLVAGWIGSRFGSTLPLILVTIGLCGVVWTLTVLLTSSGFSLAAPLFTVLPAVLMPSFLGALATIDETGRAAGMQPAFATLGGAIGPAASGLIAEANGFSGLGFYTMAVFVTGAGLMGVVTLAADRKRSAARAAIAPLPEATVP